MTSPLSKTTSSSYEHLFHELATKIGGETQGVAHRIGVAAVTTAIVAVGTGSGVLPSIVVGSAALAGLELLRIGAKTELSYCVSEGKADFTANVVQFAASTASLYTAGTSLVRAGITMGTSFGAKIAKDKLLPQSPEQSTGAKVAHGVADVLIGAGSALAGNYIGQQVESSLGFKSFHQPETLPNESRQNESLHEHVDLKRQASPTSTSITTSTTLNGTQGSGDTFNVRGAMTTLTTLENSGECSTMEVTGANVIARDNTLRGATVRLRRESSDRPNRLDCLDNACNELHVSLNELHTNLNVSSSDSGAANMTVTALGNHRMVTIHRGAPNLDADIRFGSTIRIETNGGPNQNVFAGAGANVILVDNAGNSGYFTVGGEAKLTLLRERSDTYDMLKNGTIILCNEPTITIVESIGEQETPINVTELRSLLASTEVISSTSTDKKCGHLVPSRTPAPCMIRSAPTTAEPTTAEPTTAGTTATPAATTPAATTPAATTLAATTPPATTTPATTTPATTPVTTPAATPARTPAETTPAETTPAATTAEPVVINSHALKIALGISIPVSLVGLVIGGVIILVEARQAQKLRSDLKNKKQIDITFKQAVYSLVNAKLNSKRAFQTVVKDHPQTRGNNLAKAWNNPIYVGPNQAAGNQLRAGKVNPSRRTVTREITGKETKC